MGSIIITYLKKIIRRISKTSEQKPTEIYFPELKAKNAQLDMFSIFSYFN